MMFEPRHCRVAAGTRVARRGLNRSNRAVTLAVLLTLLAPVAAFAQAGRITRTKLPNGLTVILLEDHSLPLVSVQTLYKSGSAAETK